MNKMILMPLISLLITPLISAYYLNNDNYQAWIGIVSGGNLSNDNYQANVNIYGLQEKLENDNYKAEVGYLYVKEDVTLSEDEPSVGGGGQSGLKKGANGELSTPYYDVLISGVKPVYNQEDVIKFNITIINKGDEPDADANLVYYLLSPNKTRYGESFELFEEVPPICKNMTYNRYDDVCELIRSGRVINTSEPYKTILPREIALPLNTQKGEWFVYVEYDTEVQDLVEVYKSFRVGINQMMLVIIGTFALLMTMLYRNKKVKYVRLKQQIEAGENEKTNQEV